MNEDIRRLKQQIADLQQQVWQLLRELARKPVREAMPLPTRRGWWLGVTQDTFVKGTDATVEVAIWEWNIDAAAWQASGVTVTARDWFLEDDVEIAAGTKVRVDHYDATWVLTAIMCAASEDPDITESLGD